MDDPAAELDHFQRRYGTVDGGPAVERVRLAKSVQERRLSELDRQLDELLRLRAMALEAIQALDRSEHALLMEALKVERQRHPEGWSPTPVLGFRAWRLDGGGFAGAWQQAWTQPVMEARCLDGAGEDEVPHTDGRCGVPACGLYALKRASDVLETTGWHREQVAAGLVAMTGKVVEHTLGYRAERMRILALAIPKADHVLRAVGETAITGLINGDLSVGHPEFTIDPHTAMCRWLTTQKENNEAWTSESKIA